MTDRRRILGWAATSTRLVVGAAVAAAVVIAVVVGVAAPWPGYAVTATSVDATPAAADTVVTCAGGLLAQGRNSSDAAMLTLAAAQAVVRTDGASAGVLAPSPAIPASPGAAVLTAAPAGGQSTDVAAAGSAQVDADDLRGYAASDCRTPLMESWLVGGATTTGSADLVLLSNPGEVPATVALTVYGPSGAQTPTGARGIVVAPGTQRILALSGIELGAAAPVVRVTASGAPVTATLQSSITRTLLPGGVDQIGAIAAAGTELVIPGVVVTDSAAAVAAAGATTIMRLLSPQADGTATVTVSAVGGAPVSTREVPVGAGVPVAIELAGLAAGTYTVDVSADVPVVGAVWQTTGFGEGADFAWYAAAPEVSDPFLLAVPAGPSPTIVVTAGAEAARLQLQPVRGSGAALTLSVDAGSSGAVALAAGVVYRVTTTSAVHAMLSYAGDGALAAVPVQPAAAAASVLTVRP